MAEAAAAVFHFFVPESQSYQRKSAIPGSFFLVIGQFQFCFIESFDVFPDHPFLSCFMHQHRLMRLVIDHKMLHWKTVCKMLPDQRQNLCLRCDHRKQNPLFQLPESQKFTTVPCLLPVFLAIRKMRKMVGCSSAWMSFFPVCSASTIIL